MWNKFKIKILLKLLDIVMKPEINKPIVIVFNGNGDIDYQKSGDNKINYSFK